MTQSLPMAAFLSLSTYSATDPSARSHAPSGVLGVFLSTTSAWATQAVALLGQGVDRLALAAVGTLELLQQGDEQGIRGRKAEAQVEEGGASGSKRIRRYGLIDPRCMAWA